ncbi:DUF1212-domain-containing protein [Aspergillus uvarum CBS 121591]|uniref:DUF1212-domain-containing protein n=1 Tax=Aspergillus uvarum CBS 121591 TaxID=1448315 RepID=A0A319CPU2_9EURO|nr:DUF1212-domain-containing protein [Aspergillus uvarum CBS 121591]PYH86141.1 DUF1212-domain-containing protein [Aspergillus uvarum CBS 121591]
MSEPHREGASYELLDRENSFEGHDAVAHNPSPQTTPNSPTFPEDVTSAPPPSDAQHETSTTRPTRVRFRSVSNHGESAPQRPPMPRADSDYSVRSLQSVHSMMPTSDSADLTEYFPGDGEPGPEIEAGVEPSAHRRASPPTDGDTPKSSIEKEEQPAHPMSARDRWKHASKLLRQKTVNLGERLGRPSDDDGGDLGAAMLPDDLERGLGPAPPRRGGEEKDPFDIHNRDRDETPPPPSAEAHRLVRSMTQHHLRNRKPKSAYARSGTSTPDESSRPDSWYGGATPPRPGAGGGGILAQLLKLHAAQAKDNMSVTDSSDNESVASSGTATPRRDFSSETATPKKEKLKWYKKSNHHSTASLVSASMNLSRASLPASADTLVMLPQPPKKGKKKSRKTRLEDEIRVTVHIAEILARQRYIMQLCRALMRYGAPTHRLEEYMQMTARVLEVEGQFLYLPGCMIMSFDDPTTRTAEVKLVRVVQGVDLGRLAETHNVYKNVVHDLIGVEEAIQELDFIMKRPPRFNKWILVLAYGLASCAVGPFAFEARPIDMPIIFFLGSLVGLMQHVLAPRSVLYSNVFEVTAAILTSFLARAFGSIHRGKNADGSLNYIFCFSALAQSSIALILPGFMVLCSSLELQSHQMIAGSIRMVYSIIYSLFLGYGITVGTTIYGLIDGAASSTTTCPNQDVYGSKYTQHFVFVPIYVIFLAIINQGKWKQVPVMIVIATCGYVTNYFSTLKLGSSSEVANTVGAFTIGLLGNLYSRLWHGHAATAILPGIFVLVPSGLASSGSLLSGIEYADEVRENLKNGTSASSTTSDASISSLGFGMIQVAIGITVGLFVSALIVYPFGKRRSGLFSF